MKSLPRGPIIAAICVFLATFAARLLILSKFAASPFFLPEGDDTQFYNEWALKILSGAWTDGEAFYGLPGYAYLLAGIYSLLGYNFFGPGLVQAALDGLVAVMILTIANKAISESRIGSLQPSKGGSLAFSVIAALAWTAFQPSQCFSVMLMPTSWLVCGFWGAVWIVTQSQRLTRVQLWTGIGLLTGVISTIVATILFLIPLYLIAIWRAPWTASSREARLRKAAITGAVLLLTTFAGMSPAWIHNYFVAREPVLLSAHSGINLWIGNHPGANGYPKMPPGIRASQAGSLQDSLSVAQAAEGRKLRRWEVSRFWTEKTTDYIRQNPWEWATLMMVKLRNFWNAYTYDDLAAIKLFRDRGVVPPGLGFGVVSAIGLPSLFIGILYFPRLRWVSAAVLLHMLALMPVFITERYRLAAVPGLIILGTSGLWFVWIKLCSGDWTRVGIFCVALASSTYWVSRPPENVERGMLDHYKAGIIATELGELDLARRDLGLVYASAPNNAEICFAMGNLFQKLNAREHAKDFYQKTLSFDPRHVGAANNAGVMALEDRQWSLAESFFTHTAMIAPQDAKAHYLLARARFGKGDQVGAEIAIENALAFQPNQPQFLELKTTIKSARKNPRD